MSVTFRQYYVSRPSIPPVSSVLGGSIFVAHRRINKNNQRSEISPIRESVTLPATITPQTYSDTYSLLRDEILVSLDGVNWKIAPSAVDHVGALSVGSYSASWADTTILPNQSSTAFSLQFGDFSPSSEPTQNLYLLNIGSSIQSLTFNFLDFVTNSVAVEYAGLIEVSILGVYSGLGNNPDNSFNQTFLWNLPEISLNTVSLLLPNLSFAKISITLKNYPLGAIESQQFNLSLSVTSNLNTFTLTYPNQWPSGSFIVDDSTPFSLPIVEEDVVDKVKVNPFQFNDNGILRANLFTRVLDSVVGSKKIVYNKNGTITSQLSSYVNSTTETTIATYTQNATSPYVTNVVYPWPIKPQSSIKLGDTSSLVAARFVTYSSGTLEYATTAGSEMGVLMFDGSNLVATSGLCFIELDATISKGSRLSPTSLGKAVAGSGSLIALEDGVAGQKIKAGFVL